MSIIYTVWYDDRPPREIGTTEAKNLVNLTDDQLRIHGIVSIDREHEDGTVEIRRRFDN